MNEYQSFSAEETPAASGANGKFSSFLRRVRTSFAPKPRSPYWADDDKAAECYECHLKFNTFRRKHHCRVCGILYEILRRTRRVCSFCERLLVNQISENANDNQPINDNIDPIPRPRISISSLSASMLGSNRRSFIVDDSIPFQNDDGGSSSSLLLDSELQNYLTDEEDEDNVSVVNSISEVGRSSTLFPRPGNEDGNTARSPSIGRSASLFRFNEDPESFAPPNNHHRRSSSHLGMGEVDFERLSFSEDNAGDTWIYRTPLAQKEKSSSSISQKLQTNQPKKTQLTITTPPRTRSKSSLMKFSSKDKIKKKHPTSTLLPRKSISKKVESSFATGVLNVTSVANLPGFPEPSEILESPINEPPPTPSTNLEILITQTPDPFSQPKVIEKPLDIDLNAASFEHARKFLYQILLEAHIDNIEEWHKVILHLLMQVSLNVAPDVKGGDEIDIRHYVKVKKVPGGVPNDSFYLSGVVCTKSLVHKSFLKPISNPRILLLSFGIEFNRIDNRFISLESLLSQEKEHVGNIAQRIIDLNPDLVLIEKSVSNIALQLFIANNITVAFNIKSSVMEAVARCTQATLVTSIDKLTLPWDIKLGNCANFEVQTFINKMIPGIRKTYLQFKGCPPNLGCTLVIRGQDFETLGKIKQIIDLMVFVVYNLKLESFLFRDEFAMAPVTQHETELGKVLVVAVDDEVVEKNSSLIEQFFTKALLPYENIILSASPFVKFSAPFLILRAIEEQKDITMKAAKLGERSGGVTEVQETTVFDAAAPNLDNFTLETRAGLRHLLDNNQIVSPFAHQNLLVLYSVVCKTTNAQCQLPEIIFLEYYRDSDMTIGQYLEDLCLNALKLCPVKTCEYPMLNHIRSYSHFQGRINVIVEEFPSNFSKVDKILMWSRCSICELSTPAVLMSDETWNYSFGKYVELTYYHRKLHSRATICPHNIHQDHVLYFGVSGMVVKFEYSAIDLVELSVPPLKLILSDDERCKLKVLDMKDLKVKISSYYNSVIDRIEVIFNGLQILALEEATSLRIILADMRKKASLEEKYFLQLLQQNSISSLRTDTLAVNVVKCLLPEKIVAWDAEFSSFIKAHMQFDPTKELRKLVTSSTHIRKIFDKEGLLGSKNDINSSIQNNLIIQMPKLAISPTETLILSNMSDYQNSTDGGSEPSIKTASFPTPTALSTTTPSLRLSFTRKYDIDHEFDGDYDSPFPFDSNWQIDQSDADFLIPINNFYFPDHLNSTINTSGVDNPIYKTTSPLLLIEKSSPSPIEHKFKENEEDDHLLNPGESNAFTGVTIGENLEAHVIEYEDFDEEEKNDMNLDNTTAGGGDKTSLVKSIISNIWSGNSVNLAPLEYPMYDFYFIFYKTSGPIEHIFPDSLIIVREDEPSSVIAFTLSSKEYRAKLASMHSSLANQDNLFGTVTEGNQSNEGIEMELYSAPSLASTESKKPDPNILNDETPLMNIEETLLRGAGTHIKYQFADGSTRLHCKIFFTEQFDALRRYCGCAETFVESLTRSFKWDAMGGKSGSAFLKTRDDRLVLKQLSKYEMDAFLKFAPIYFEYMSQALFHELPTVLAKIFGVYRIGFKNSTTGKSMKLDVLVMENLFYDRKISRIFDLKGSIRNRHVQSTGKKNEVLMDENLVEFTMESPLFIREHSKRLLRASVWNDTLFLSKLNVMDYSLLVGIDENRNELVVGIVDFIRTFTWDKKLESWVKESGFLGSGKAPTIVSPQMYKKRFREAMERYFLLVPEKHTTNSLSK